MSDLSDVDGWLEERVNHEADARSAAPCMPSLADGSAVKDTKKTAPADGFNRMRRCTHMTLCHDPLSGRTSCLALRGC